MKKIILAISGFIILGACTHQAPMTEVILTEVAQSSDLFPYGVYKQDIHVSYKKDGKTESNDFKAILKKTATEINMYCYVGFGIALFKVKDNLKDPIEFSTTEPRIEKNKEFFLKMYPIIKEAIQLRKDDKRLKNNEIIFYMPPEQFPVTVKIGTAKIKSVPAQMTIENKEHFSFEIVTRELDFL